ncbi:hypothetical protein F4808DRAFT_360862 [Astrocystis sublimbata]|nr:hypothetical protein F4808DRAFT_360862 [Astrocystis sublimbata]
MRLRQSNKKKQYQVPDYAGLDLGDSDAEATLPRPESSGDEFVVVENNQGGDEDNVDDLQDEAIEVDDDDNDDDVETPASNGQAPSRNSAVKAAKSAKAKSHHTGRTKQDQPDSSELTSAEVPPYPSDPGQRWTRTYQGPIKRWTRFYELIDWWFGDKPDRRAILDGYLRLWYRHELIPPKLTTESFLAIARNGWMPPDFADSQRLKFLEFYNTRFIEQFQQQKSTVIDKATALRYCLPHVPDELLLYIGHASHQTEYRLKHGETMSLSDAGHLISEIETEATITGGWLLDMGGIPVSMAWAPAKGQMDQYLAIAVDPFSDQAYYRDLKDAPKEQEQHRSAVQILKFSAVKDRRGILRPSLSAPTLAQALCFSWGRISRLQWCPVAVTAEDAARLLAVLFVDGKLRIISVPNASRHDGNGVFEQIEHPMILLEPPREHPIEITCFTWVNMNRVATGLSDGSVMLWSLSPTRILLRHPIHSTAIVDIVSGYPTDPFIVSTVPVGGVLTLTDLTRPSAETTYHPNMMVSLQPNLLAWSPHLRGYASMWPSAFAGNPNLTFLPVRGFPLCRHLITVTGLPTCISIGTCHPYILIGSTDGSVWVFNMLRKLSSHREKTTKLKFFQHEFHNLPPSYTNYGGDEAKPRGACRILNGFLPEPNSHPTGVKMAETQRQNREAAKGKGKGKAKAKSRPTKAQAKSTSQPDREVDEEAAMTSGPGPIVLYEPQTRITGVAWNPNIEFSWWAAATTASGLVRVMDIGSEPQTTQQQAGDEDADDKISGSDEPDVDDMDVHSDEEG